MDLSPAEAAELFDLLRMFSRLDPTDRIAVLELAQTLAETPESS